MNARLRGMLCRMSSVQLAQQLMIARVPSGSGADDWMRRLTNTCAGNLAIHADSEDALGFIAQMGEMNYALGAPFMLCYDPDDDLTKAFRLPSPLALAASQSTGLSYEAGALLARHALARGVRMLFLPRLDVANVPPHAVSVLDTLGDSPQLVGVLGTALAMGIAKTGAQACALAYPGEGGATLDAGSALRVVKTGTLLASIDAPPFEMVMGRELAGLLLSGAYYDALGCAPRYASGLLTSGLRGTTGFSGVVVTPCYSGEDAVRALKSGVDMLLLPADENAANQTAHYVLDAARRGAVTVASLMRAAGHVLSLKEHAGLMDGALIPPAPMEKESDALCAQIFQKSLTRLGAARPPLSDQTLLILPGRVHRRVSVPGYQTLFMNLSPSAPLIDAAAHRASECSSAVVAVADVASHPEQLELARRVSAVCADTRIVCTGSPDDALYFTDSMVYLTYGEPASRHPTLLTALRSGEPMLGVCPLRYILTQF